MALTVVGVNHRGAPLDVREKLSYRSTEIDAALDALRSAADAGEGVLLSTCNRTEI